MAAANRGVSGVEKVKPMRSSPASPRWARCAVLLRFLGQGQHAAGVDQEQAARLRQPHPAFIPFEQAGRPRPASSIWICVAQRRLADVQARRGPREMQFLGDGDEVAELAQFHYLFNV